MSTCTTCGGLIMERGVPYGWAGAVCHCLIPGRPLTKIVDVGGGRKQLVPVSTPEPTHPQGWQCPICKTVHAPHIQSCPARHGAGE